MSEDPDAPSTVVKTSRTRRVADSPLSGSVLGLTILWHPDLSRVGSCAPLMSGPWTGATNRTIDLSRLVPPFDPVADRQLNRKVAFLTIVARPDQSASLIPNPNSTVSCVVNGQMLEGRLDLSPEQLKLGPVLVLADAIVVCLHLVREPRFPLVGETFQMVGHSDAIDSLRRNIEDVAHRPPGPVLILGESGSGKEHVARALTRPGGPFIKQNMATLGANLAASALFGHERGAFTGAVDRHDGLFVEADGGTLFLDEIAATPIDVQPMLLDALESDEIKPVGGSSRKSRRVRVRLVAATNADLNVAVRNKQFLGTLLQRFDYQIRVPPLRARREDVGELLLHFLRKEFAGEKSPLERDPGETPWLSANDFARIAVEPFVGNVRQLRAVAKELVGGSRRRTSARIDERVTQVFERETVAAEEPALTEPTEPSEAPKPPELRGKDAPLAAGPPRPRPPSPRQGSRPRRTPEEVVDALRSAEGSAGRAAAALGVSRTTFFELRKDNPAIRALSEISDAELKECREACKGDVVKMAQSLLVPLKPLTERLAKLK